MTDRIAFRLVTLAKVIVILVLILGINAVDCQSVQRYHKILNILGRKPTPYETYEKDKCDSFFRGFPFMKSNTEVDGQ